MKIHTKKTLAMLVVITVSTQTTLPSNDSHQEPIHHHSSPPINVPSIVDGTPFGINGHEIRKLIFILREVEKLMFGVPDPITKVKIGKYKFQNMHHCVASLAEFEIESHYIAKEDKQELKLLLKHITDEFIKIATPFIEQARGVKTITLGFMKEWSEKHHRENSLILNWTKEKDGHEFDSFRRDIDSFENLYQFCQDLTGFLSDLIQSCPRAWQQFLELQKKKK
jgi:hypothetical protein